jgi:hypothetical protein
VRLDVTDGKRVTGGPRYGQGLGEVGASQVVCRVHTRHAAPHEQECGAGWLLIPAEVRQDLVGEIDGLGELALVRPPGEQQPGARPAAAAGVWLLGQQ